MPAIAFSQEHQFREYSAAAASDAWQALRNAADLERQGDRESAQCCRNAAADHFRAAAFFRRLI